MTPDERRALIVTDVTMPGGVGNHIGGLALAARARSWTAPVVLDWASAVDTTAQMLESAGITVVRGPTHRSNADAAIESFMDSAVERFRPRVLHVHCGSPRSAIAVRKFALASSIPLIFTEHYVAEPPADDILAQLRTLYEKAFAVISVCDANRARLRDRFGLIAERHVVIRNSVALFPPRIRAANSTGTCHLVTVARLTPQKGLDILLRALAALPDGPDCGVDLTIFGSGELDDELRGLAADLGVTDRVRFDGWRNDIRARLAAFDLFVLPSRSEGQPIALLEAMAEGLPCVASAVSGIPEALGDGAFGALVPPESPSALAAAIAAYRRDPLPLQAKAAAARRYLQSAHDPETNNGETVALWHRALTEHDRRA